MTNLELFYLYSLQRILWSIILNRYLRWIFWFVCKRICFPNVYLMFSVSVGNVLRECIFLEDHIRHTRNVWQSSIALRNCLPRSSSVNCVWPRALTDIGKSFVCKPVHTPQCNFVSHLILQSTGGSTGEDEEDLSGTCLETKHNTHHNEFLDHELIEVSACDFHFLKKIFRYLFRTRSKVDRCKRDYLCMSNYACFRNGQQKCLLKGETKGIKHWDILLR